MQSDRSASSRKDLSPTRALATPRWLAALAAIVVVVLSGLGVAAQSGYVPERVFDTARGGFTDFEAMVFDLTRADVVFVGEQHDDPNTHRLEAAVLEGLLRRRTDVIVSLEMFERDVQDELDHFSVGHMTEEEFLSSSRPWPRYRTDYKPLVDLAVAHGWSVIAANVPRAMASEVSKGGFEVLEAKTDEERRWFAADRECPTDDEYFRRFVDAMGSHPAGGSEADAAAAEAQARNYYYSQCLKDETMAESIAEAFSMASTGERRPVVVHFNGAFHSDFGLGTAARVKRRLAERRTVVISVLPVENLDTVSPGEEDRRRADYLVYTLGR
jgi:uncharacterized iron-regulated protein